MRKININKIVECIYPLLFTGVISEKQKNGKHKEIYPNKQSRNKNEKVRIPGIRL